MLFEFLDDKQVIVVYIFLNTEVYQVLLEWPWWLKQHHIYKSENLALVV